MSMTNASAALSPVRRRRPEHAAGAASAPAPGFAAGAARAGIGAVQRIAVQDSQRHLKPAPAKFGRNFFFEK